MTATGFAWVSMVVTPATLRAPVLALLAFAVAACGYTEPLGGVRVNAAVDRTSVSGSDSVKVTVSVTNEGRRPVEIISPGSYGLCFHAFRVLDGADREASVLTGFCVAASTQNLVAPQPMDLPPGATVMVMDYWKPGESTLDGYIIPPGQYRVLGMYHVEGRAVLSAPMTVTVEFPAP